MLVTTVHRTATLAGKFVAPFWLKSFFLELNAIALMKANGYTDEQTSSGDDLNGAQQQWHIKMLISWHFYRIAYINFVWHFQVICLIRACVRVRVYAFMFYLPMWFRLKWVLGNIWKSCADFSRASKRSEWI